MFLGPLDKGPFGGAIALTFDDGPSTVTTRQFVQVLRNHRAPATFFVMGNRINAGGAAILAEIAGDNQFMVGNHTTTHPIPCSRVSLEEFRDEVEECQERIQRATGQPAKFFRFPGGDANSSQIAFVQSKQLAITGWNIDTNDWRYARAYAGGGAPANFLPSIRQQAKEHQGGIYLMHDIHAFSLHQLDGILSTLEQDGYRFVRLDDMGVFPKLNQRV